MRFCCVLVSLLLVHAVNGDTKPSIKDIPKNVKVSNLADKKLNQYSDLKNKPISLRERCIKNTRRDLKAEGLRKLRQADYFETLADNFADKEFSDKGVREQNYLPDDKYDLKYENGVNLVDPLNRPDRNLNQSTFENYDGRTITDRGIMYGLSDEESPYPMRQERNVFFDDDGAVGLTQMDTKTSDLMKLLRRNNDSPRSDASLKSSPGSESNTQIPINDDVADFAVYLKKKKKIQSRSSDWKETRPDLMDNDVLIPDHLNNFIDTNYKEGNSRDSDWYYRKEVSDKDYSPSDKSSVDRDLKSINFDLSLMKDFSADQKLAGEKFNESSISDIKQDDIPDSDDFPMVSDRNTGSYWTRSRKSQIASSLPMTGLNGISSLNDIDGDKAEGRRRMEESHTLGVVRDRMIELPEPLIFNSSHVVSSFVYSMIPFRSPLLNLLESDKHSKYIMIKVDPILQKSGKLNHISSKGLVSVDLALEKNILQFIDKSISSELSPEDENSHPTLEGSPAKARTGKSRNKYRKEENRNRVIDKGDQYIHYAPPTEDKSDIKSPLISLS